MRYLALFLSPAVCVSGHPGGWSTPSLGVPTGSEGRAHPISPGRNRQQGTMGAAPAPGIRHLPGDENGPWLDQDMGRVRLWEAGDWLFWCIVGAGADVPGGLRWGPGQWEGWRESQCQAGTGRASSASGPWWCVRMAPSKCIIPSEVFIITVFIWSQNSQSTTKKKKAKKTPPKPKKTCKKVFKDMFFYIPPLQIENWNIPTKSTAEFLKVSKSINSKHASFIFPLPYISFLEPGQQLARWFMACGQVWTNRSTEWPCLWKSGTL